MYLLLLFLAPIASSTICPGDWAFFDGLCWGVNTTIQTWLEAAAQCGDHGGSLAAPKKPFEVNWVGLLGSPSSSSEPVRTECFEREGENAWAMSDQAALLKTTSLTGCQSLCERSTSTLGWACTRLVFEPESKGCLLLGSPSHGEPIALDSSLVAFSHLCWLEDIAEDNDPAFVSNEVVVEPSTLIEEEVTEKVETVLVDEEKERGNATPEGIRRCFSRAPQAAIMGFADEIVQDISVTACLSRCQACTDCLEDESPCQSVVYYESYRECVLLHFNESSGGEFVSLIEDEAMLFWRKKCGPGRCLDHLDVIFLLDGSDSIGAVDFAKALVLIHHVAGGLKIAGEGARFAVYQVGATATEDLPLGPIRIDTITKTSKLKWRGGRSLIGSSISSVMNAFQGSSMGGRVFVTITDAMMEDDVELIELEIRKSKAMNIVVSLSELANLNTARRIASDPSLVFAPTSIEGGVAAILKNVCPSLLKKDRKRRQAFGQPQLMKTWIGLKMDGGTPTWLDGSPADSLSLETHRDGLDCGSIEDNNITFRDCEQLLPAVCTVATTESMGSLLNRSLSFASLF